MKNLRLLLLLLLLIPVSSCHRDKCDVQPSYMSDAIISGQDFRKCSCCGGWFLYMGDVILPEGEPYYQVDKFPDTSLINSRTQYPLKVRIDWIQSENPPCGIASQRIIVTRMALR